MGVFYEQAEVVNRTSKVLHGRYDGQDIELLPNYSVDGKLRPDVHNMVPAITVPYLKSQNVLMGSEDPLDPTEYDVLVGVKAGPGGKQKDEITFLEQTQELTRVRLEDYLDDPNAKIVLSGRKIRNSEARPEKDTMPFDVRPK